MSLPPGFLDELRTRLSMTQVAGRKVIWDQRKSNQGKGDMWSPCPFHQEKTASFHVDDQKGYYYCFGCHAKGDAISFVRETENVSFMEAVEILAREAGMPVPERDPKAQEKADRLTQLADVMEVAVQHFRLQLKTLVAAPARDYLAKRGLSDDALARWEIGFAPDAWQGLWDVLKAKNIEDDLILGAGLAKPSTKGGRPYDTFRGRIIFPIRDARGRCIAFGGRAMDPNDNAKYLNSPETELFDKGRSLYNHGPARTAVGKGQQLIVAEGYMDVIALSEGGFTGAVAPLGTAVTETQLQMLWRVAPEPIVALDGDTAGLRAAMRVMDLAMPVLEAGRSLRFSIMPPGQDPDDVIRAGGAPAIQALLDQARPLVHLMWQRETEGKNFDSPERKAALDKTLREAIRKITDPSLRAHYGDEIKRLRWELFNPRRSTKPGGGWRKRDAPMGPTVGVKQSALVSTNENVEEWMREAVILALLIVHPDLIAEFESDLDEIQCHAPDLERIRRDIVMAAGDIEDFKSKFMDNGGELALESLLQQNHIRLNPGIRNENNTEQARVCLKEEFAKLEAKRGADLEISEAELDIEELADEGLTWRLGQAAEARNRASSGQTEDKTVYDRADTGAKINRKERDAFDALLEEIGFSKLNRAPR